MFRWSDMHNLNKFAFFGFLTLAFLLASCAHDEPLPEVATAVPLKPTSLHSIVLPHEEPELPPGPGREAVLTACVICHSPRYITMQPAFSRDVWKEEVNKMIKTFGAPVKPDEAESIVNYLVSIRGKAPKAQQP